MTARIAIVMKQLDAVDTLDDFLTHHGQCFGTTNVFVLDNGSKNPVVKACLDRHARCGGTVIKFSKFDRAASKAVNDLSKELSRKYDAIIPLDADEFVVSTRRGVPASHLISNALSKARGCVLRYAGTFAPLMSSNDGSVRVPRPAMAFKRFVRMPCSKVFVRAHDYRNILPGHHGAMCRNDDITRVHEVAGLWLVHFHSASRLQRVQRSFQMLIAYGYILRMPRNMFDMSAPYWQAAESSLRRLWSRHKTRLYSFHNVLYIWDHLWRCRLASEHPDWPSNAVAKAAAQRLSISVQSPPPKTRICARQGTTCFQRRLEVAPRIPGTQQSTAIPNPTRVDVASLISVGQGSGNGQTR